MRKMLVVLVGPTAVGKTKVSVNLADRFNCPVLDADSRQVFKEMSIGTAKPTVEEMANIKLYFVNDRSINEDFSAGQFETEALHVLRQEFKKNSICIMSGGSGLYIDAVCNGLNSFPEVDKNTRAQLMDRLAEEGSTALFEELKSVDPEYAAQIEANNSQRIVRALEIHKASGLKYSTLRTGMNSERFFDTLFIGLERPRDELYSRINQRMDIMIEEGLFEEARGLVEFRQKNALQTVGYNEIFMYLDGMFDKTEAIRLLKRNSRRYAKRQITWFKRNINTKWFHPDQITAIEDYIRNKLHT